MSDLIKRLNIPACFVAITPFNLKSEKTRFPVKVIFSTSVIRPSVISKTKSTRLSDNSITFGVTIADIRPVSAYAVAILSVSFSTCEIKRVCLCFDVINSFKLISLNVLFPSKLIEFMVGFSITFIFKILLTIEISTVLKYDDFFMLCKAEFN